MTALKSFGRPIKALVVGASGAIGGAFVDLLAASSDVRSVLACSRKQSSVGSAKIAWRPMDILDEDSIETALCDVARIDLAIVATGRLHIPGEMQPEKSWRALDKRSSRRAWRSKPWARPSSPNACCRCCIDRASPCSLPYRRAWGASPTIVSEAGMAIGPRRPH